MRPKRRNSEKLSGPVFLNALEQNFKVNLSDGRISNMRSLELRRLKELSGLDKSKIARIFRERGWELPKPKRQGLDTKKKPTKAGAKAPSPSQQQYEFNRRKAVSLLLTDALLLRLQTGKTKPASKHAYSHRDVADMSGLSYKSVLRIAKHIGAFGLRDYSIQEKRKMALALLKTNLPFLLRPDGSIAPASSKQYTFQAIADIVGLSMSTVSKIEKTQLGDFRKLTASKQRPSFAKKVRDEKGLQEMLDRWNQLQANRIRILAAINVLPDRNQGPREERERKRLMARINSIDQKLAEIGQTVPNKFSAEKLKFFELQEEDVDAARARREARLKKRSKRPGRKTRAKIEAEIEAKIENRMPDIGSLIEAGKELAKVKDWRKFAPRGMSKNHQQILIKSTGALDQFVKSESFDRKAYVSLMADLHRLRRFEPELAESFRKQALQTIRRNRWPVQI